MRYDKTCAIVIMGLVSPFVVAQSNIDPVNKHAWNENAGYSNWRDADGTNAGAVVGLFGRLTNR